MFSREQAEREAARRADDEAFWAVCLKESGKLIGNLYLSEQDFVTRELRYVFNPDFWDMGYAFEATKAMINEEFQNQDARRIIAMCNPQNERSWRLL